MGFKTNTKHVVYELDANECVMAIKVAKTWVDDKGTLCDAINVIKELGFTVIAAECVEPGKKGSVNIQYTENMT